MRRSARDQFRSRIADTLGVEPDSVTLFARGRVALYAILRALSVGPGDEVILPAFTCVAVPNAILYAGARPVWVDIEPSTYVIDANQVAAAVSPRTRVILAQNTFGLSSDVDALSAIATDRGLTVVDDCAHGLGGSYRGRPNGATAPFSFFSTQWSKPISTGLGGFAIARNGEVAARLRRLEEAAREPSAIQRTLLRALVFARERAGRGRLLRDGRTAYRALGRLGALPGSSSGGELRGTVMPVGFMAKMAEWQARLGTRRIGQLAAQVQRRRSIARRYSEWLSARGRTTPTEPPTVEHAFLKYPLRVTNRGAFVAAAEKTDVDLGDWFVSPIHPVGENFERWGYSPGTAPTAERACREVVNLPTDLGLGDRELEKVLAFLADHVDQII